MPQKQYRTNFPVQPDAKVACWYGEKEGHMKKAIQRLRKAYPGLIVRCFPGLGHGEIINHPALRNLPFYLETPNEPEGYAREIALLRGLYKGE